MTNLWNPDRQLTLDLAIEVIRSSLPSLRADDLTFLGAGWEFDAYLTSDGWVVRFPRRQEMAGLFEKDERVHPLVARYLPVSVSVPRIELQGKPAVGFPYPVAAHRFIPGVSVDELDERFLTSLASQLGSALSAIHSIPSDAARLAGVVEEESDGLGRREWLSNGLAAISRFGDADPMVRQAIAWVQNVSNASIVDATLTARCASSTRIFPPNTFWRIRLPERSPASLTGQTPSLAIQFVTSFSSSDGAAGRSPRR